VPGERADFVQFDWRPGERRIEVIATWLDGRRVYRG